MSRIEFATHPIVFVKYLRRRFGKALLMEFNRYKYVPRSLLDENVVFQLPISQIDNDWLENELMRSKRAHRELALTSRVIHCNHKCHIPMIDFVGKSPQYVHKVKTLLPKKLAKRFVVFSSGQSFHAYCGELVEHSDWIRFMGTILLANLPEGPSIVDQRWVGHRLRAGYSSLRWSFNSSQYKKMPELINL